MKKPWYLAWTGCRTFRQPDGSSFKNYPRNMWHAACYELKMVGMSMKLRKRLGFLTCLVLLTLLFCPYMEAATQPKVESDCHGEPTSPVNQNLHSCCNNDAIPVQQFHIVTDASSLQVLVFEEATIPSAIHSICYDSPLLYRTTVEHLSSLSVLRL